MTTTNVPAIYLGPNGYIAPQQSAILAGEEADIDQAFGGGVNFQAGTAANQIATTNSAVIGNTYASFLALANGIDPAYASGRMQDAICRIYFLTRNPGESTVSLVTCSGLPNTQIPVNATIVAEDGNQYTCTEPGTIPLSGSITLPFACAVQGPIACPAQTFTIYRSIPGWDSAISSADGALGSNVESQAAFELRRQGSVAANSLGMLPSIRGAVLNVPGVLDVLTEENWSKYPISFNPTAQVQGTVSGTSLTISSVLSGTVADGQSVNLSINGVNGVTLATGITISSGSGTSWTLSSAATIPSGTTINLGGIVIAPNSIYVAVAGGASAAIAAAILTKKMPGCGMVGNTTVTAYDTSPPYPSPGIPYSITYETPADIEIYFLVPIVNNPGIPSNAASLIQTAIVNAFSGEDGGQPAQIAVTTQVARYTPGILALGTWAQIQPITVATSADTPAVNFTASISGMTMTVTAISSGSLSANQIILGTNVSEGTAIVRQLTGTAGGTGTYSVNNTQTVASESMTALNVTASSFTTTIAGMPVTSSANINVVII